jgi:hypothetical protein
MRMFGRTSRNRTTLGDLRADDRLGARQAAIIIAALALGLLLVPVGAQAARFVEVLITDPGGVNQAAVDGTGALKVAGEVNVTNSSSSPVATRDVENPARNPFQRAFLVTFSPTETQKSDTFTVPSGKRLVIEQISVDGFVASGQKVRAALLANTNSDLATFGVEMVPQGSFPGQGDVFVGNEHLRVYADPGTTVFVTLRRNDGTGDGRFEVGLSGYLVDAP